MNKITVHDQIKHTETVEEYIDFNEIYEKYKGECVEYKFETPELALTAIINYKQFGAIKLHYSNKIENIETPIYYKGVKIESYFEWNGYVFIKLMGFCNLAGKTDK